MEKKKNRGTLRERRIMLAQREAGLFKARSLQSRCRRLCAVSCRAKPPGLVPEHGVNYVRFAVGASFFESTSETPVTQSRE